MTFRFPTILRLSVAAAAVPLLTAAAQFPLAPAAAIRLIAVSAPADELIVVPAADNTAIAETAAPADLAAVPRAPTLSAMVARHAAATAYGDRECLARAVYFEARGEPLEGQLAVAQVILNRVASGRFSSTVCGVIAQRGQFSFDRSRLPVEGRDWRVAKAIAAIAATAGWDIVAPRATAFHATRINASWTTMRKVGTIGNHVFYR